MIERERFKAIMGRAPGPATVVTALDCDGTPQGLTMSAVCAVSLDPPMILVCLDRGSNTLRPIREHGSFTVNYLRHGHEEVALNFASKSRAKFDSQAWELPPNGVGGPVLYEDIAAYAVCRVTELIDAGDHVIAVAEVLDGDIREDHHALAYARQQFFTAVGA